MKVLILTEERYATLMALEQAEGLGKPKAARKMPVKLPDAKELHAMARNGGEPEQFTAAREKLEALGVASDQIRGLLHELIAQADEVGVPPGALARWSGYTPRRIHQLTR
jgi:hypothetical protein